MFEQKTKGVEGPGTIVGANVKLSGTLKDINDITIHGQIEGEVISDKTVSVEQTAVVKGPIKASLVTIAGQVNGEIIASKKLEILETGNVRGSIATDDLIIKSGAIFNGKSSVKEDSNKIKNDKNTQKTQKDDGKKTEVIKNQQNKKYELE